MIARLKQALVMLLLGAVLSGGVGTYVYFKLKGEVQAEISTLETRLEATQGVLRNIQASAVRREEVRRDIDREGAEIRREIEDVKQSSEESRDYLAEPVPLGVRSALERAYRLSVPSTGEPPDSE